MKKQQLYNKPNVLLVASFVSTLFFTVQADASWFSKFNPLSHLQLQTTTTFDNLLQPPSQAPSPSPHYVPAPSPSPTPAQATANSPQAATFSSSPANAPASAPQASSSQTAATTPVSPDDPALGDICDKTDYPELCRTSVVPFLHKKLIDRFSILKLSIEACVNHTQAAIQKASELAASSPDNTEIIQVCQESYATAVDALQESALALASHDLGTFRTKMSSVITSIGTCDETYGEDPEMESSSPLTAIDQTITRLASNILAIGERVQ